MSTTQNIISSPRAVTVAAPALRVTHFHVKVRDVEAALAWFAGMCDVAPTFKKPDLAYLTLGQVVLVLETATVDAPITIAFASTDCDSDYAALVARGAAPLTPPTSHPWGIRGAYIVGPGAITFELEQRIAT